MGVERPSLLVLVRHAESARNVAKKGNRFFLDDESRRPYREWLTTMCRSPTRAGGRRR